MQIKNKKILTMVKQGLIILNLLVLSLGISAYQQIPAHAALSSGELINSEDEFVSTGTSDIREYVRTLLNILLTFLGLVAVIIVMYGGFLLLTGKGEKLDEAKKIITYAVVGIIIIAVAFALVNTALRVATLEEGSTTN
jgi:hypothetical protein